MAKARSKLADLLSRWSKRLFTYLSDHEETSGLARRIKLPLLGILVILIGWVSTGGILCWTGCYLPLDLRPHISDASVTPNPTQGVDSVEVKARAYIEDERAELEEIYIDSATCYITNDTDTVFMTPDDGEYGDVEEYLKAKLYIGDLEPGIKKLVIGVWTNNPEHYWLEEELDLEITEAEEK